MSNLVVIPARSASTRFPGKPFATISGIAMLERVWRIANSSKAKIEIVVATDDEKLATFASGFGANVVMTSASCRTGMDRVAQAYREYSKKSDVVVSLQADAVLMPPWVIDSVISVMDSEPEIAIATPAVRLSGKVMQEYLEAKRKGSSTGTTVTVNNSGMALYFSKGVIPHSRNDSERDYIFRHIGMYAFRPETLLRLSALEESYLEKVEKLEQLRALENGIPIKVVEVDYRGRTHASVDNPEDISIVEEIIRLEGELL